MDQPAPEGGGDQDDYIAFLRDKDGGAAPLRDFVTPQEWEALSPLLDDFLQRPSPFGLEPPPPYANAPMSSPPNDNALAAKGAEQRSREFRLLRFEESAVACWTDLQLAQTQSKSASERFRRYRRDYREARGQYDDIIDATLDPDISQSRETSYDESINFARSRMEDARELLERQSSEARDARHRVNELQARYLRRQARQMKATRDLYSLTGTSPVGPLPPQLQVSDLSASDVSTVSKSAPRLDARLLEYYDRAADVKLAGERLVDHDQEYSDAMIQRGLRQDRDEILSTTDEDFDQAWQSRRRVLVRELDIAIADADRLREICEAADLDINAWRKLTPSSEDESGASTHHAEVPVLDLPATTTGSKSVDLSSRIFSFDSLPLENNVIRGIDTGEDSSSRKLLDPKITSWLEGTTSHDDDLRRLTDHLGLDGSRSTAPAAPTPQLGAEIRRSEPDLAKLSLLGKSRQQAVSDLGGFDPQPRAAL